MVAFLANARIYICQNFKKWMTLWTDIKVYSVNNMIRNKNTNYIQKFNHKISTPLGDPYFIHSKKQERDIKWKQKLTEKLYFHTNSTHMCNSRDIPGQCPKFCCVKRWMPYLDASPVQVCLPGPCSCCHPWLCLMSMVTHLCLCLWYQTTICKVLHHFHACFTKTCLSASTIMLSVSETDGQPLLFLSMY
jgi:hypothetical protein